MSADNGIYILRTNYLDGYEYRVAHLQAIDNVSWDEWNKKESMDKEVWIRNARRMWKGSSVFTTLVAAIKCAEDMEDECGWTEYGITTIEINKCFYPSSIVKNFENK